MTLFKKLQRVILACALAGISLSLSAHDLNDTSAQVILRDGQQEDFIKKALKQKMRLIVNAQVISVERVTLANNTNTDRGDIVFQAQHDFPEVTELSISFHKSLGAVHVSFVKPKYKLLSAGESADVVF